LTNLNIKIDYISIVIILKKWSFVNLATTYLQNTFFFVILDYTRAMDACKGEKMLITKKNTEQLKKFLKDPNRVREVNRKIMEALANGEYRKRQTPEVGSWSKRPNSE